MLGYYLDQKNLMQNFVMNTLKKHPNWALIMASGSKLEIANNNLVMVVLLVLV